MIVFKCVLFDTPAPGFSLHHRVNPSVGSSKPSAQPPGCHPPSQVLLDCQNKLREACGWGGSIVGKKWDPGILDPGPFSGQIRKVEARLGKLAKIMKVDTD